MAYISLIFLMATTFVVRADKEFFLNTRYTAYNEVHGMNYHSIYQLDSGPPGFDRPKINYNLTVYTKSYYANKPTYLVIAARARLVENPFIMTWPKSCHTKVLYDDDGIVIKPVLYSPRPDEKNERSGSLTGTLYVETSGDYKAFFLTCSTEIHVKGSVIYENSFGLLGGKKIHYLKVYYYLFIAHMVLLMYWVVNVVTYKKYLRKKHYILTIILFITVSDIAINVGYLHYINNTGLHNFLFYLVCNSIHALAQTTTRVMICFVCIGYGVRKSKKQKTKKGLIYAFGLIYFTVNVVYYSLTFNKQILDKLLSPSVIISLVVYGMDIFVTGVCFVELIATLEHFEKIPKAEKKEKGIVVGFYSWYLNILFLILCFSLLKNMVEAVLNFMMILYPSMWFLDWILTFGYWQLIHFIILILMILVWLPDRKPQKQSKDSDGKTNKDLKEDSDDDSKENSENKIKNTENENSEQTDSKIVVTGENSEMSFY